MVLGETLLLLCAVEFLDAGLVEAGVGVPFLEEACEEEWVAARGGSLESSPTAVEPLLIFLA